LNCAEAEEIKRRTVVRRERRMRAIAALGNACVIRDLVCGLGSQILGNALTKGKKTSNFKEREIVAELKVLSRGSSGQISTKPAD
jgi:hypothetical protein